MTRLCTHPEHAHFGLGHISAPPEGPEYEQRMTLAVDLPAEYEATTVIPILNQGSLPWCEDYTGEEGRMISEAQVASGVLWSFDIPDLAKLTKTTADGTTTAAVQRALLNPGALCDTGPQAGKRIPVASAPTISSMTALKSALIAEQFVGLGHDWYESWFTPEADGTLPAPDEVAGGHEFRICGFSDTRAALHVANSWGTSWGQAGYCWLPYAYLSSLEAYTQIASPLSMNVPFTDQGADGKIATPKTNIRAIAQDGSLIPIVGIATVRKGILGGAHPGPAHSFARDDGDTGYILDRNFNFA